MFSVAFKLKTYERFVQIRSKGGSQGAKAPPRQQSCSPEVL